MTEPQAEPQPMTRRQWEQAVVFQAETVVGFWVQSQEGLEMTEQRREEGLEKALMTLWQLFSQEPLS